MQERSASVSEIGEIGVVTCVVCVTGCGRSLSLAHPGVSPADRVTVVTAESCTGTWTRYAHTSQENLNVPLGHVTL